MVAKGGFNNLGIELNLKDKLSKSLRRINKELDRTLRKLSQLRKTGLKGVEGAKNSSFGQIEKQASKGSSAVASFNTETKKTNTRLRSVTKSSNAWAESLGRDLSLMFGFMAINQAFMRLTSNLIRNFKELTQQGTNPLAQSFTRLQANLRFLGFALMDAAGPMLITMLDAFSSLALTIARMDPGKLKLIAGAIGAITAITGLGFIGSQMSLFVNNGLIPLANTLGLISNSDIKKLRNLGSAALKASEDFGEMKDVGRGADNFSFIVPVPAKLSTRIFTAISSALSSTAGKLLGPTGFAVLAGAIAEGINSIFKLENFETQGWAANLSSIILDVLAIAGNTVQKGIGKVLGVAFAPLKWFFSNLFEALGMDIGLADVAKGADRLTKAMKLVDEGEFNDVRKAMNHLRREEEKLIETQKRADANLGSGLVLGGGEGFKGTLEGLGIKAKESGKKFHDFSNSLQPTLENLESASILSATSAADVSKLGDSIRESLTPSLEGKDGKGGLNKPLSLTADNLKSVNNRTVSYRDLTVQLEPKIIRDTELRWQNAEALGAQASAAQRLADAMDDINDEAMEAAELGV